MAEAIELEKKLLAWINAQPNRGEIKAWMLGEHQRRIEWQDDNGVMSARALDIDNDVMDALYYMAGLASVLQPPRWIVIYSNAYFSLIVGLRREMNAFTFGY